MYRVKQPAQDLDFRFSVQMPKIPLHILHLNTPSSGRMGKCDVRMSTQRTSGTFPGSWTVSRVSVNSDYSLSIHTPGHMLVILQVAFQNNLFQPLSSLPYLLISLDHSLSSHLLPQPQCTQTPKLPIPPPTCTPTSSGKAQAVRPSPQQMLSL